MSTAPQGTAQPRFGRWFGWIALLLALIAITAGAGPAHAQDPAAPTGNSGAQPGSGVVNSWSLSPTGTDPSQPSTRVYLSYTLDPGATVNDSVTLWNYSNVPLTFHIYPSDAFNDADGGFDVLAADKAQADVATWVTLPQENISLPAQAKADLPFSIHVPAGARPGDHAAAILAANAVHSTDEKGNDVQLDRRTGSRVYIRINGLVTPALVVDHVHTVYHQSLNPLSGSLDVTYTVRNTGNVRLGSHQHLEVDGPFGLKLKTRDPSDVPELLPGNAVTLHQHFNGVPALVQLSASIKLSPIAASGATDVTTTTVVRTVHTWAIPWSLVALAIEIWLIRRIYLAYKKRKRVRNGPPPRPMERELTKV